MLSSLCAETIKPYIPGIYLQAVRVVLRSRVLLTGCACPQEGCITDRRRPLVLASALSARS